MKAVLFLGALMFAGTAVAQTAMAPAIPAGGQQAAPSNAAPRLDARGIPVISNPATVPPGFNNPPGMGGPVDASQPAAPMPATTTNPPPCSRTVTDNCVQTYERHRH